MRGFVKRRRKAQGSAAALVAIIGLVLVLYILFLPPAERERLLEGSGSAEGGTSSIVEGNLTLLEEHPGRLDVLLTDEIEHDIPPVYLYTKTSSEEVKRVASLSAKNSVFEKRTASFSFSLKDPSKVKSLLLAFTPKKAEGDATITLNGRVVFSGKLSPVQEPIELPLDYIGRVNEIGLSVSGGGWKFWKANEALLENIRVIGSVTDTSRQDSTNLFLVSDTETFNLDKVILQFNPECLASEAGSLSVLLNKRLVFSGVPDCGTINRRELPAEILRKGENTLEFRAEGGSYLVDNIVVKTRLKEMKYPLYFFDINSSVYEEVRNGSLRVVFRLEFFDDKELKQGTLLVNNRVRAFSTRDANVSRDISGLVELGSNALKVVPDNSALDVISLKVVLEED